MSENGDPEVSRIFSQKVDRRFQRDFGRFLQHSQNRPSASQQKNPPKANEAAETLRRQLNSRNEEIERLKQSENEAKERAEELQRQLNENKLEKDKISESRRVSKDSSDKNQLEIKFRLDDYQAVLSKYKTWMKFADQQMRTMKTLLEEHAGWTEENRYKIYFAYRAIQTETVTHENVAELATGSIIDYPGAIEDIEGITATRIRPKFHSILTQTDENMADEQASPNCSQTSLLNNSFSEAQPTGKGSQQMSALELRLLEYEQQIQRLEFENAKIREQQIILSDRAKHVELLEEQKQDLQMQRDILRQQNEQLIRDHEQLKCVFGGGSIMRNSLEELVRNAEKLKLRNQELEQKVQALEVQKESGNMAEARRIAQIFKQKYDRELTELRLRLNKYEPIHPSDTTRILRFAHHNPLDEAHDEHLVKQAALAPPVNPLKRRKMDDADDTGNISDVTFLVTNEDDDDNGEQIRQLRLQLANVKQQMEQNDRNQSAYLANYRDLVALLCGYNIRMDEDGFCEAENVNSKDCTFIFQKHPPADAGEQQSSTTATAGVDLLDNECASKWKDVLENYLVRYQSVPAFLSAVTISLVESPETPISSSNPSSAAASIVEETSNSTFQPNYHPEQNE